MTPFDRLIGFIGAGNMAEAFIGAIIGSGLLPPAGLCAADVDADRLRTLADRYGIATYADNFQVYASCDLVVLAVKPQQMQAVLTGIAGHDRYGAPRRKLILSIAAGYPLAKIAAVLYPPLDEHGRKNLPIVRVMPNTPALVLTAMSGMSANRYATAEDLDDARRLLEAVGKVVTFPEKDLDAVTALSGSGPAYVFYLAEALIAAGVRVGLSRADAELLTVTTLKGAVKLLETTGESAEALRRKVTSPGGTTEAAVKVFEARGFKPTIIEAIGAAAKRAEELSR
jgi:pyrroline-5-carboxylate reductase